MGDGIDFSSSYMMNLDGSAAMEIGRSKMGAKMREKAEKILDAARDNAPVDTGALRDSGHIKQESEEVYQIIFDPPVLNGSGSYARYVEEGTSKMDARSAHG